MIGGKQQCEAIVACTSVLIAREYLIEMFLLRKFRFTSVSVASRALGAMVRESVLAQVPLT